MARLDRPPVSASDSFNRDGGHGTEAEEQARLHPQVTIAYSEPTSNGISANLLYLASLPHVILYANGSEASQEAFALLDKTDIRFSVEPAGRRRAPVAVWDDMAFRGVSGIRELIQLTQDMDQAFLAGVRRTMPELLDRVPSPANVQYTQAIREVEMQQRMKAHAAMERLIESHPHRRRRLKVTTVME